MSDFNAHANPDFSQYIDSGRVSNFSVQEELQITQGQVAVELSPDEKYLMTKGDKGIVVYENSRPLKKLIEVARPVRPLMCVWSQTGRLATGWADGHVIIYDANRPDDGAVADSLVYPKGYTHANCWAWLNDDIVLTTGSEEAVQHYSVAQAKVVASYRNPRWGAPLTYSRQYQKGVVCGADARLVTRGVPGDILLPGDVRLMDAITFSHDGSELITSGHNPARYSLASGQKSDVLRNQADGHSYITQRFSTDRRILGMWGNEVHLSMVESPEFASMVRFRFPGAELKRVVWAENQRSALVCTHDQNVFVCRPENPDPVRLPVADAEAVYDAVWNEASGVALLIGENNLLEWDPDTNVVKAVREIPAECNRRIEINPSGTYVVIAGASCMAIDTASFATVLQPDWRKPDVRWLSDDELVAVTEGGTTLRTAKLSDPSVETDVRIPIEGYVGREGLTFSPVAPVAAAIVGGDQIRFFDIRNGAHLGTLLLFGDAYVILTPEGRIVGMSPDFQQQIVYQIKTDEGQETLTSSAFLRRFGQYLTP